MENKKFFEHFKELNYRIYISLIVIAIFFTTTYINYTSIYEILIRPLISAGYSTTDLVAFTIYEGFQVKILNTFFVSLTLAMPLVIFILGYFFKPALDSTSHITFLTYLIIFITLFYLGIFSAYKTIPIGINFLLEFNESEFILRSQNYFQLISRISILFGLSFQTPLVIYFLIKKILLKELYLQTTGKKFLYSYLYFQQ